MQCSPSCPLHQEQLEDTGEGDELLNACRHTCRSREEHRWLSQKQQWRRCWQIRLRWWRRWVVLHQLTERCLSSSRTPEGHRQDSNYRMFYVYTIINAVEVSTSSARWNEWTSLKNFVPFCLAQTPILSISSGWEWFLYDVHCEDWFPFLKLYFLYSIRFVFTKEHPTRAPYYATLSCCKTLHFEGFITVNIWFIAVCNIKNFFFLMVNVRLLDLLLD